MKKAHKSLIVCGAGIGGLAAAIHARLLGADVLVLEGQPTSGGKARRSVEKGFRFDPGPSIIILPEIYESVFQSANRPMSDYLILEKLDTVSRIFYEGRSDSIDIPGDYKQTCALIESLNPKDRQNFEKAMNHVDAIRKEMFQTFFSHPIRNLGDIFNLNFIKMGLGLPTRLPFKKWVDVHFQHPILRTMFYGFPSYSGNTYLKPCPGALTLPYFMLKEGVYYPKGGVASIVESFQRLAEEIGVQFRFNCKIAEIKTNEKSILGVVNGNGETFEAEDFIFNIDYFSVQKMLNRKVDVRPSFSYFTIQWGLARKIEGLSHHNLIIPESFENGFDDLYLKGKFPNPPIVYLNEVTGIDPESAPAGAGNLLAVVTAPSQNGSTDWHKEADLAKIATLKVMSDANLGINPDDILVERIQTPLTFESRDSNYCGSLYGASESQRGFLGMPYPNKDVEYNNLAYCGGSVQPGAGLPMACLSGKFAAESLMDNRN